MEEINFQIGRLNFYFSNILIQNKVNKYINIIHFLVKCIENKNNNFNFSVISTALTTTKQQQKQPNDIEIMHSIY